MKDLETVTMTKCIKAKRTIQEKMTNFLLQALIMKRQYYISVFLRFTSINDN